MFLIVSPDMFLIVSPDPPRPCPRFGSGRGISGYIRKRTLCFPTDPAAVNYQQSVVLALSVHGYSLMLKPVVGT